MDDTNHQGNEENGGDIEDESSKIAVKDSDDEYEDYTYPKYKLLDKATFQKIKQDDPSIINLTISISLNCNYQNGESFFNNIDWKKDGDCLSNNTQLKKIKLSYSGSCLGRHWEDRYILGEQGHNLPTREQLRDFFSSIYQNRSIDTFEIEAIFVDDEFGGGLIEGLLSGHPNIDRIRIGNGRLGSIGCEALGEVLKHPQSKLKELRLVYCQLDDEGISILCDGLVGNSTMKKLSLYGNTNITSVGWRALLPVLQHPNCKLIDLDLPYTGINDEGANILGSALNGSSLKFLNLTCSHGMYGVGWQKLFNQLSQTTIEHLGLFHNNIEIGVLSLLGSISTLKSVDLASNRSSASTPSRWQSFFNSLQRSNIKLKRLSISYNHIGNEGMAALGSLISTMSSLKTLEMDGLARTDDIGGGYGERGDNVTPQGWLTLFGTLQNTNLNLMKLNLRSNQINDEGVQLLISLVSRMTSLKVLSLGDNVLVTHTGWQALTGYLQSPNFALEELHLDDNDCGDDAVNAFTSALVHKKTLKTLRIGGYEDVDSDVEEDEVDNLISERGWQAVSTLLCNKTCILDTYASNHTLQDLGYQIPNEVADNIGPYVELNKNEDKVEVARQKILQTHFRSSEDNIAMQDLLDMELEMIPAVIAWIGRPLPIGWEGTQVSGLSTMFNLLRRIPDLFDSNAKKSVEKEAID